MLLIFSCVQRLCSSDLLELIHVQPGLQGIKKTPGGGRGRKRKASESISKAQMRLAGLLQLMSQLELDMVIILWLLFSLWALAVLYMIADQDHLHL